MRRLRLLASIFLLAALLTSCYPEESETPTPDPDDTGDDVSETPPQEGYLAADDIFTLNYSPGESLNPLTSLDVYNEQLFGLIYEGLFALDGELKPHPVLCESYETRDGKVFDLKLRDGVKFHGGGALTATDVVYSLIIARGTAKYSSRLGDIEDVTATEDGGVRITLKKVNYCLPSLLDVPIIETGEADKPEPRGTGPYIRDGQRLTAFTGHRDYGPDTLETINLKSFPDTGLAAAFTDRTLDLIGYDPTGPLELNIHLLHEKRFYDTTDLIYLGFNTREKTLSDVTVRRALMRLVNAEAISSDIFDDAVRPSRFILNPALGYYTEADTRGYEYSRQDFSRLALVAGLADANGDGYLEHGTEEISWEFIVCEDSPRKAAAARRIVNDMQNVGLRVELRTLSWEDYEEALREGDFDMYLAEAKLRADFDITPMVAGGALDFGGASDPGYAGVIEAYLSAPEEESRARAALELCRFVAEDAAIVPIAYKQYAMLTHLGVVSGAEPSESGLFNGAAQWSVDMGRR